MPFWMWALGRFFIDSSRVTVPYGSLVRTLFTLVLPLLVGVLIRKFSEKGGNFFVKVCTLLYGYYGVFFMHVHL